MSFMPLLSFAEVVSLERPEPDLPPLVASALDSVDWPFSPEPLSPFWDVDWAAACAAACAARSFLEALPRFFLSRMYSQPRPNSAGVRG